MGNAGFQTLVIAGLIAAAPQTAPAPSQPAAKAADEPEKKICKSIVKTGSIMAQRFCLTRTEWREFNEINGKTVDTFLHGRGTGMCDVHCDKQVDR